MKSAFGTLTLTGIICLVSEFAYAVTLTPCSTCGVKGAPGPEIGDGVVGFGVAAAILFTVTMLPRIKRLLQNKSA